jgi:predicted NBD/HSP70 family sugar kinase
MATAGDQAMARAAHAAGWVDEPRIEAVFRAAEAGSPQARASLAQRAGVLADVVAHVADMVEPDRLVIAGQAFSADPLVVTLARELIGPTVRVTRFGSAIQAHAACAVALRPVDANPLAIAPRARRTA